jgi:hypothetical protein
MEPGTLRFIDKTAWGEGPWQDEPDRQLWFDEATGFPCLINRNGLGTFSGYVGLPKGHPWHGSNRIPAAVYNGPDYAGPDIADISADEGYWWIGFACVALNDLSPPLVGVAKYLADKGKSAEFLSDLISGQVYHTAEFVRAECAKLAKQAAEAQC